MLPPSEDKVERVEVRQVDVGQQNGTVVSGVDQNVSACLGRSPGSGTAQHQVGQSGNRADPAQIDALEIVQRVEIADRVVAVPIGKYKRVGVEPAKDDVIAAAPVDGVETGPAIDRVIACAALDQVIAAASEKAVIACIAIEGIVSGFAEQAVVALAPEADVIPVPAEEPVKAEVTKHGIVACTPVKVVSLMPAIHQVISIAAVQQVKAAVTDDGVVATLAP